MDTKRDISRDDENVVSVVISVRNAAGHMQRCLAGLERQILPERTRLQVIVVDNSSDDDSRVVAQRYGATVVRMKCEEFTWGGALNKGLALAKGRIVLLLSSDAYASDSRWLYNMIKPFEDPKVAAVYGRQIPYRDAPVDERVRLQKHFPPESVRFNSHGAHAHPSGRGIIVSNACAAIRRDVWLQLPYDDTVTAGEEGPWSYEVLRRGYSIVYEASAKVYHSHKDNPLKQAWRHWELRVKESQLAGDGEAAPSTWRWLASFAKRRIRNCLCPGLPMSSRVEGVAVLPLELAAFALVELVARRNADPSKLKQFFWR